MHEDVRVSYFHYALLELLKRLEFYTLYATALEKDGQGILIPGCSGRGKTTAFVSLLRAGFRCISDNHPLLHETQGQLEFLAFEEKVDITEHSLKFFPELSQAGPDKIHQGIYKKFFYIEDFYQARLAEVYRPRFLLFCRLLMFPTAELKHSQGPGHWKNFFRKRWQFMIKSM